MYNPPRSVKSPQDFFKDWIGGKIPKSSSNWILAHLESAISEYDYNKGESYHRRYITEKYGSEILTFFLRKADGKISKVWYLLSDAIDQYNKDVININQNFPVEHDVEKLLLSQNLPLSISNLSVEEQIKWRRIYPFAWISQEITYDWIKFNNNLVDAVQKMHAGVGYIKNLNTREINRELSHGWHNREDYRNFHIQHYQQYMYGLNHNKIISTQLTLFYTSRNIPLPRTGETIKMSGFLVKNYLEQPIRHPDDKIFIISYPSVKFLMDGLNFVTFPNEEWLVRKISNDREIYCDFLRYSSHIQPDGTEIIPKDEVVLPNEINESLSYALEEIDVYYQFKKSDSSEISTNLIEYQLDAMRKAFPDLAKTISYFARIPTINPKLAYDFYQRGYRTLKNLISSIYVKENVKKAIWWRSHLKYPIKNPNSLEILKSLISERTNVKIVTEDYQRFELNMFEMSDLVRLGSYLKDKLDEKHLIIQLDQRYVAELVIII